MLPTVTLDDVELGPRPTFGLRRENRGISRQRRDAIKDRVPERMVVVHRSERRRLASADASWSNRRERMRQIAPEPSILAELVAKLTYRPGWTFTLGDIDRGQGSEGLTLDIVTLGYDSYHPERGEHYGVHHFMPVPPAAYNRQSWQRWLFEQILLVERHEACEFFAIDGEKPYGPNHGPGWDPYIVTELSTDEDRRTSFRGEVKPRAPQGRRA